MPAIACRITEIDAAARASYELRSTGPDGVVDTFDDVLNTLNAAYEVGATEVTLAVANGAIGAGCYRMTARGIALHDLAGNSLDGDGHLAPGGDYRREFSISFAPTVADVRVGSSAWTDEFREIIGGSGFAVSGEASPARLSQMNIDQVSVRFGSARQS